MSIDRLKPSTKEPLYYIEQRQRSVKAYDAETHPVSAVGIDIKLGKCRRWLAGSGADETSRAAASVASENRIGLP